MHLPKIASVDRHGSEDIRPVQAQAAEWLGYPTPGLLTT
jgi:hypothetical protein